MNKFKLFISIILFIFVVIQFFGPERTNPKVEPSRSVQSLTQIPPDVLTTLKRACYDCHSNETTWPAYSYVAPVSWLVIKDVNDGRSHINFSEWAQYSPKKVTKALEEICEEVQEKRMPLPIYLLMHSDAKLSDTEVETICAWTNSEITRLTGEPVEESESDESEEY